MNKQGKISLLVSAALVLGLSLLLAACGEPALAQTAAKQDVAQAVAQPALGGYVTRITVRDLQPQLKGDLPASGEYLGKWELRLQEEGRYTARLNGFTVTEGRYNVNQDGIVFTGGQWASNCPDNAGEAAVYHWINTSQGLSLASTAETCAVRWLVLNAHPLVLNNFR